MNIRNLALKILVSIESEGAYSTLALNNSIKENKLNKTDSSFLSALVYGVLERQITLDYIIKQYSKIPLRKIELKTKIILRLGILQLVFMDKVPDSAAVNESVKLAKKNKLMKSSGFINGVLRSVTRADEKYSLPDINKDREYYYSVKYSCPRDLVSLWLSAYGENATVGILENLSGRPQLSARVNTLKTTCEKLIKELESDGVTAEKSGLCENALVLKNTGSVEVLNAFKYGEFYIQDIASQLCVKALNPQPNDIMIDVCSAPGGKSFTSAQYMENRGKIYSFDIYEHKLSLINSTAKRLGIDIINTDIRDAEKDTRELPTADKVLCDVPCSGLGVLSRKPEIRYKKNLLSDELCELQYRILLNSAKFTAYGGTLVYSTCTLNPAENIANVNRFLKENSDFTPDKLNLGIKSVIDEPDNVLTLFPNGKTDGFFIAKFKREKL
ncbi:MAG: 16S rRNA (cytosine(967)-C(5))-methyltransferase RsmB [Ruminococcus sp.]|nr:16S rRNA (cytosine(967)-C(5))-methyltransferase RsmB [Ruminococcus sp.]